MLLKYLNEFDIFFQNIFISLMCVLFLIILALLQFRVIQDSYLLSLCYGILLAATILCVMSMPALNKIIPIDTKEVSLFWNLHKNLTASLVNFYNQSIQFNSMHTGFNWRCLASNVCSICYVCSNAASNLGGNHIRRFVAHNSYRLIDISNADGNATLLRL